MGNFIRDFDVRNLGRYVADMVNRILNIDTSSEDTWRNLGEIITAKFTLVFGFVTGFLENLDTAALAKAASGVIHGIYEALTDSIENSNWKRIGTNIRVFFENVDWKGLVDDLCNLVRAAFGGFSDFIKGLFGGSSDSVIDWKGVGETISNMFAELDWGSVFEILCGAIGSAFGGLGQFLSGLLGDALDSMMDTWMENIERCGGDVVAGLLLGIRVEIPDWVPGFGGKIFGFSLPTFSAPQIPYLAEGGVLKKGQAGLLEGSGAEAVVPLERNTEWINKMADAFMARVQSGSYDLTGNAKTLAALEAISDRVAFRQPAVAEGKVLPYCVSGQAAGGGFFDTAGVYELLQSISDKLDRLDQLEEMVSLLANMQFVADFGDNIRALARRITKEQRRNQISEGR